MARIVNSRCVLAVRDLGASTRYYLEALGFTKDPIDAAGWSFLTRDSFRVMLGECPDERPAGELGNHSYVAYWNVDDVDELYRELSARGALLSSAPDDKPWGLREFGLRTPDGHRITCGQIIDPTETRVFTCVEYPSAQTPARLRPFLRMSEQVACPTQVSRGVKDVSSSG